MHLSLAFHSSSSLQVGVSLLLVGIVALNRVRMEIPLEKENQTKLVKFMIRMGVFSVLYLAPLLTVIGCYLYEHTYRTIWETTWMEENCRRYHIPCPYKVEREDSCVSVCVCQDLVMLTCLHDEVCFTRCISFVPAFLQRKVQQAEVQSEALIDSLPVIMEQI